MARDRAQAIFDTLDAAKSHYSAINRPKVYRVYEVSKDENTDYVVARGSIDARGLVAERDGYSCVVVIGDVESVMNKVLSLSHEELSEIERAIKLKKRTSRTSRDGHSSKGV